MKIIGKLQCLGIKIEDDELKQFTKESNSVGRPHIANLLVKRNIVGSIAEAFDRFLKQDKPAYVSKEVFSAEESIRLIREANGLSFLAHPITLNKSGRPFELFLDRLIDYGLDGIEVFAPCHSIELAQIYKKVAFERKLLISTGSDFHGFNKPDIHLGDCFNNSTVTSESISRELLNRVYS